MSKQNKPELEIVYDGSVGHIEKLVKNLQDVWSICMQNTEYEIGKLQVIAPVASIVNLSNYNQSVSHIIPVDNILMQQSIKWGPKNSEKLINSIDLKVSSIGGYKARLSFGCNADGQALLGITQWLERETGEASKILMKDGTVKIFTHRKYGVTRGI